MFSATVITGMSMKCWCTIPIALRDGVLSADWNVDRLRRRTRISPSSGLVEAVEDVHERRLARAVLSEERVHLSAPEVEVDVVVRERSRELLRDAHEAPGRGRASCIDVGDSGGGPAPTPWNRLELELDVWS